MRGRDEGWIWKPRDVAIACLLVPLAATLLYARSVDCGFAYDDAFVIVENEVVTDGDLVDVVTSPWWGSLAWKSTSSGWRPLTILTYRLDHAIAGANPAWYHGVNAALHGIVTLLVLWLAMRITRDSLASVLAAGLFALHAGHSEAVVAVVGRAELLAAVGAIGALVVHAGISRGGRGRGRALAAAGVATGLYAVGLGSKEIAIAMPLMAVLLDVRERTDVRRTWPAYAGYALVTAGFLAARFGLFGSLTPAPDVHFVDNPVVLLGPLERVPAAVLLLGKATATLLLPVRLSSDWGYDQLPVDAPLGSGLFWLGAAVLVAAAALAPVARRRRPDMLLAAGLLLVAWLPVSNLLATSHTVFGERTLYLPSLGLCLLAGHAGALALRRGGERMRIAVVTGMVLFAGFHAVRSYTRIGDWTDDHSLASADVQTCPRSVRLLNNHANALMGRGRDAEACRALERAVAVTDAVSTVNANLGLCLLKTGRVEESIVVFEDVLETDPDDPVAGRHLPLAREILDERED